MGIRLSSDRFCNHRFPRAGWAVKQHAFGRVDAETAKQFWMLQREFNHLANLLQLLTNATDVLVGDAFGLPNVLFGNGLVFDDDLGVGGHHYDAFWHGLDDGKWKRFSKERHTGDKYPVAGNHGSLG